MNTSSVTRASGPFVADGFCVGQSVAISGLPEPWYYVRQLAAWWERRVLGVMRRPPQDRCYTIASVEQCVIKVDQ